MRMFMSKSAGVLSALAMAVSLGACAPAGVQEDVAMTTKGNDGATVVKVREDHSAERAAEARAAAAEAKLQCERDRQAASNRGAVVGGVAGAVIGSQVAGDGAKSEGGAIGAVTGVLAGRQVAKKDHRC